jgi:hypothetical protein
MAVPVRALYFPNFCVRPAVRISRAPKSYSYLIILVDMHDAAAGNTRWSILDSLMITVNELLPT